MPNVTQVLAELRAERNHAQQELQNLDEAIRVIHNLNGSRDGARRGKRMTRTLSAAGRARIAAAQRARWAKVHQAHNSKPKRKMSLAARKKIAAAQRARWAKQRAGQKKAA